MRLIFKIFITLLLFITFFYNIENDKIFFNLKKIEIFDFIVILSLIFFSLTLIFFRFFTLYNTPFGKKISLFKSLEIFISSIGLSQLPLPGAQEVYKYFDLSKLTNDKEATFYFIILERLSGLIANLLLTLIITILILNIYLKIDLFEKINFSYYYFNLIIFISLILITLAIPKILNRVPYFSYINQFIKFFYVDSKKLLIKIILISTAIHLTSLSLSFYVISLFLEINFNKIILVIFFIQVSNLVLSIPISFFGIGTRDWLYLSFFSYMMEFNKAGVASSSILINLFVLFSITILCLLNFFIFFKKKNKIIKIKK